MSKITIHAGDYRVCKTEFSVSNTGIFISFPWEADDGWGLGKSVKITKSEIEEISIATEENVKKIGGTVGWGIAGNVLLGPVGLLAGLLLGGRGKDITFILKTTGGQKMLATTDSKTYTKLQSLIF